MPLKYQMDNNVDRNGFIFRNSKIACSDIETDEDLAESDSDIDD